MNNEHENANPLSAGGPRSAERPANLGHPTCGGLGKPLGQGEVAPHSQLSTQNSQLVYAYTRSQAIADGFQVEVSKVAREAGISYPVFLTRAVYDQYVIVPLDDCGQPLASQDEAGRLWDIVWMLRFAIRKAQPSHDGKCGSHRLPVALYVRNDNRRARLIKLIATCGPLDIDDPAPAITVMMPDED